MDSNTPKKTDGAFAGQARELLQLVSFNIGSQEFGVDILKVREINRVVEITRVPQAPHYVEGVINLRGKVIPIIDLRKRFDMVRAEGEVIEVVPGVFKRVWGAELFM